MGTTVLLASSASMGAAAFGVGPGARLSSSATALHLLPTQGAQLAAASSCAYDGPVKEEAVKQLEEVGAVPQPSSSSSQKPQTPPQHSKKSARSFVSRVFSLPSTLLHPKEAEKKELEEDSMVYPVVGFKFVCDKSHHFRALPTISNPSCRLTPANEDLVGYYSPACHLDCSSNDDDDVGTYSQMP